MTKYAALLCSARDHLAKAEQADKANDAAALKTLDCVWFKPGIKALRVEPAVAGAANEVWCVQIIGLSGLSYGKADQFVFRDGSAIPLR
jgi:hypothetical protein